MAVLFDDDISGDSADVMDTAGYIERVTAVFTTLPSLFSTPDLDQPNHILRAGWISFARVLSDSGSPAAHWRNPLYLNFTGWIWEPGYATYWVDAIEWHIGLFGVVHLHVEG